MNTTDRKQNSYYTNPKKQDSHYFGWSLVEMLGVLGIIGVLSAGGLAGYSKAMFSHQTTQTIDMFSEVVHRFAELKNKDLDDDFSIRTGQDLVKYFLLDECREVMVRDTFPGCKMPMGTLYIVSFKSSSSMTVFLKSSRECVAFMLAQWQKVFPPEWWQNYHGSFELKGTETITFDTVNLVENMSVSEITDACDSQCNGGDCEINFNFPDL